MANGQSDGTTNPTTYSQGLQQLLGQPQTPGVFGYGFSQADIQRLQAAGITPEQLMQMGLSTQPQTTTSPYQSGGGGGPTTSPSAGGIQQGNNAALLQAMLKLGGGQQQQAPPAPGNAYGQAYPLYAIDAQGNPTGKPFYANPTMQANLLGSAALLSNPVINLPPSGTPSSVSGVAPTGGALIGSTVPRVGGWTWPTVQSAFQLQPNDITEFQKQGLAPQQVASNLLGSSWNPTSEKNLTQGLGWQPRDIAQFKAMGLTPQQAASKMGQPLPQVGAPTPTGTPGMTGPWATQPGIFVQAPRTAPTVAAGATPLTAAVQPTATAYNPAGTPFAQAPPAPGVTLGAGTMPGGIGAFGQGWDQIASVAGLSPKDVAVFQGAGYHPAEIANHFLPQTRPITAAPQPTSMPMPMPGVTALASAAPPPAPSPVSAILSQATGAPTKRMQRGGLVAGRGNDDTVPALLTPGEYVLNRDAVRNTGVGNLNAVNRQRFQDGGLVEDTDYDPETDPDWPYLQEAARTGTRRAGKKTGSPTTTTPTTATSGYRPGFGPEVNANVNQPWTYGAPPTTTAQAPAAPGLGQRILQTLGHVFTGTLGQYAPLPQAQAPQGSYYDPRTGGWIGPSPGAGESGYYYANPPQVRRALPVAQAWTYGAPPVKRMQGGGLVRRDPEQPQEISADTGYRPPATSTEAGAGQSGQTSPQTSVGGAGGGYRPPIGAGGGYIGPDVGPGQTGYIYPSQAAATAGGTTGKGAIGMGGGGLSSPGAQSALSGIGSGLTQAAQAIASSVGPWQMQQSAKLAVSPAPPAITFKPPSIM